MQILENVVWSTPKIPTDMVCMLKASESHWLNVCLIDTRPKGWEICSIYMGYYCSFCDVQENRQLLRYLSWMYALELAVRFQDEWRYEKAFPLLQMMFSRVLQSVRDECRVIRVAPSNPSLAQLSLVGPKLGYTQVQSGWFLSTAFLCASSEEKRSSSVSAWQEQMGLEWLPERLIVQECLMLGPAHGESGDAAELELKALLELNQFWGSTSKAVLYSCSQILVLLCCDKLSFFAVLS